MDDPRRVPAPLDSGHTFERFVIGAGNRLAHAAALAVAELPGEAYNPLFLHGPPGLGKTHLLGAIVDYLRRRRPELTVHYTTAERFTTEFVAALRKDGPERFKQRYRRLDALLIDDVQALEGKEHTQEEFVHTFNALHAAGKQIVLSSDRPPEALARLAERLRDRFQWGLCVELEPPDLRTRTALLWRMAVGGAAGPPRPRRPAGDRQLARWKRPTPRGSDDPGGRRSPPMLGEPVTPALVRQAPRQPAAGRRRSEPRVPPPTRPASRPSRRRSAPPSASPVTICSPPSAPRGSRRRGSSPCTWRETSRSLSLAQIARALRPRSQHRPPCRSAPCRADSIPAPRPSALLHRARDLLDHPTNPACPERRSLHRPTASPQAPSTSPFRTTLP